MKLTFELKVEDRIKRENYWVTYASGMAGIGKTTFGQAGVFSALATTTPADSTDFVNALKETNFISIELNAGGDGLDRRL